MQIGKLIAVAFNGVPQIVRHAAIWVHVEQDGVLAAVKTRV
jgi:hypothetical protein